MDKPTGKLPRRIAALHERDLAALATAGAAVGDLQRDGAFDMDPGILYGPHGGSWRRAGLLRAEARNTWSS